MENGDDVPDASDPTALRKNLFGAEEEDEEDEGSGISLEQILALKERFDDADVDGGGSLDMQEFLDAFGSIINKDGSMTQDQIARLFMQIDANSDGGIDWNEFSTYMLMESQSSGTLITKKVGNFFLPDNIGQKQEGDVWHREHADCICLEPQGPQYLTSAKDGSLRIWAASSMQEKTIPLKQSWIMSMCYIPSEPSARIAITTADGRIWFYDIHTWEPSFVVDVPGSAMCICTWKTLEGEMLAYGTDGGEITVVNLSKGYRDRKALEENKDKPPVGTKEQKMGEKFKHKKMWADSVTKTVHDGWVHQVEMCEDLGGLITCSADNSIKIFEYPFIVNPDKKDRVVPRRLLRHSRGHHKGVKCFQWVRSHKLIVSGGLERELIIWNPYTCKPVQTLEGHQAGICQLQFNAEFEQVISLSIDRVVKVWDLRNTECTQTISEFKTRDHRPTCMLFDSARNRLITCGMKPQVWKINPSILSTSSDVTHRSPVVAVLYNRMFGHVVTVAEDSETCIWRPANGQLIFSYVDTERDEETFIACAAFDDNGRRLITGDHAGKVRVWNFSNGACIKVLVKPQDPNHREEITGVTCYVFEDKRFIAASSWDRKITVWLDASEDAGEVTPYMQMQGLNDDMLTIAFTTDKTLATAGTDGTISFFDVESGYKKMAIQSQRVASGNTPRQNAMAQQLRSNLYVEKILFLEAKNKTVVSAGADGHLRFWEGQWMGQLPAQCSTSLSQHRLALRVPAKHWEEYSLVDQQTDHDNNYLLTADEGGFVKVWDISAYDWEDPRSEQVVALYMWRAHEMSITAVDIVVPSVEDESVEQPEPLVLTASQDKCVVLWTLDGVKIGQFGQAEVWDFLDRSGWMASESADMLNDDTAFLAPPEDPEALEEEEDLRDILGELDERLRKKPSSSVKFKVADLKPVPQELPGKGRKKEREYEVDLLTGERVYKNGAQGRKSVVAEDKKRPPLTPFMKGFVKKLDAVQESFLSSS